jgi:hypothetical protein
LRPSATLTREKSQPWQAILIIIITTIRHPPLLLLIPRRTRHLRPIRHPLPIQHPRHLLRRPSRTLA